MALLKVTKRDNKHAGRRARVGSRRAVREARAEYELAVLEGMLAENQERRDVLASRRECPMCLAMQTEAERQGCGA